MRVLLIEDDPSVASSVRDGLSANGYTVDYVSNGTAWPPLIVPPSLTSCC